MSQICLSVSCLSVSQRLFGAFCLVCSQTRRYTFFAYYLLFVSQTRGELPASFHDFGGGEHHPLVRSLSYRLQKKLYLHLTTGTTTKSHPSLSVANHCVPSLPSTSYPLFPSFVVPRATVSASGTRLRACLHLAQPRNMTKEGGDHDC